MGNIRHSISTSLLTSSDLSSVRIDTDIYPGMNMRDFDNAKYVESNRYDISGYSKSYDAFRLKENDGILYKIDADLSYVALSIQNQTNFQLIDDVRSILGNNFVEEKYDTEQLFNSRTYVDKDEKIEAEFVYSTINGELQSILLAKY
jgi:hypothetical protein